MLNVKPRRLLTFRHRLFVGKLWLCTSLCCGGITKAGLAQASSAEPAALDFKLTTSLYAERDTPLAGDLNVRGNLAEHTAWIGHYQRGAQFEQTRIGYEYTLKLPIGQAVFSAQAASGAFLGGSLTGQFGSETIWAILGIGRTNLRPYYNLSFDPNDSIVFGAGVKLQPNAVVSLFTVADDRLGTGQRVTHLVWRGRFDKAQRLTIDLVHKTGQLEAGLPGVTGNGLTVTYDRANLFVRMGREHKVNFTNSDQVRLAAGFRF